MPSVAARLRALEEQLSHVKGWATNDRVRGELAAIRAEIEAVASHMRRPVTLHQCPACNSPHGTKDERDWESIADRLAEERHE